MPGTPRFLLEPEDLSVQALATLDSREQRVIALRYGTNGFRSHSRSDIGIALHIKTEQVRQIEAGAIRKLLALRTPGESITTKVVCVNMPRHAFSGVFDHTSTQVYRFTVDVVVDIGDREGGYWALRGVGKPKLKEVCRV